MVDDSLVVRSILECILDEVPEVEIVASCAGAADALIYLETGTADIILLDIEMPGISGLTALPDLIRKSGGASVLVLASNCEDGGPAALKALSLGAADTLAKPATGGFAGKFGQILVDRIVALANDPKFRKPNKSDEREKAVSPPQSKIFKRPDRVPQCIAIASSTGGIGALNQLLLHLDDRVSAPILLTQHLPKAFIPFFAMQLGEITGRKVLVADDGMALKPHHVYVAPGHAHITLTRRAFGAAEIVLSMLAARSGCRPSADPMLQSLGDVFGSTGLAIVLSGMGRDGSEGAQRICDKGGNIVAQTHESCVVWGMPGAIVNAGLASAILDPVDAAKYVNRAAGAGRA